MLSKVRKALKLRKLYDNWLLTLFQYKVLRKPTITVRCKDGSTAAIDRWLYVDLAFSIEERAINSCINSNLEIYRWKGASSAAKGDRARAPNDARYPGGYRARLDV